MPRRARRSRPCHLFIWLCALVSACGPDGGTGANGTLTIVTSMLPEAMAGSPYSATLSASGGNGGFAWSTSGGVLPSGLTLSVDGVLSGVPGAFGAFSVAVRVTSGAASAERSIPLTVNPPPLELQSTNLPGAVVGDAYSFVPQAGGGTGSYTWSIASGTLPAGLTLAASGLLSGTPTVAGTFTFVLGVSSGDQTVNRALDLTILPPVVTITTTSLPDGQQGSPYAATLGATGGTGSYSWSVVAGVLPSGITLGSDGALGGTPTEFGTFSPTIRATSGVRATDQQFALTIAPPPLGIISTALPDGREGLPYQASLVASGGTGSYAWSVVSGAWPGGVSLSAGGVVSGTPTVHGTFDVTVRVSSGSQISERALELSVDFPLLGVTTSALPEAQLNASYSAPLGASGGTGTYAWSLASGSLPAGLTLSGSGVLGGTPTASGSFAFTVRVTSGTQFADRALTLLVVVPPLQIVTSSLPDGSVGIAYSASLTATGGTGSYGWSVVSGALPAGLALSSSGVVSGTPGAPGSFAVTVRVTSGAQTMDRSYALSISSVALPAAPGNLTAAPATGPNRIVLAWQDFSGNETGFGIERAPAGTGSFVQIATVGPDVTGYSNSGLALGDAWSYRVRALGSGGNSGYSNTATASLTVAAGIGSPGSGAPIGFGKTTSLSAQVTNTGTLPWTFGVQATARVYGGAAIAGPYTTTVTLQPGESQVVQWPVVGPLYTAGLWDWKAQAFQESSGTLSTVVGATDWIPATIAVGFVVAVHSSAAITAAEADNALASGASVLQANDGAGDVACDATFVQVGTPSVFTVGDGSIDTSAEFNAVEAVPGNVKVVSAINWCGSIGVGIIGCASTPGTSLTVVRFTSTLEGILWAHEYGHNKGLPHNADNSFVMYASIGSTHRKVSAFECSQYQSQ